jgi:hypothetical protein
MTHPTYPHSLKYEIKVVYEMFTLKFLCMSRLGGLEKVRVG